MSSALQISGEELVRLVPFLTYLELGEPTDGSISLTASNVPPDGGVPFLRAVMRREARLLIEDADAMEDFEEPRTGEQRRSDAFIDVLLSVTSAMLYTKRSRAEN